MSNFEVKENKTLLTLAKEALSTSEILQRELGEMGDIATGEIFHINRVEKITVKDKKSKKETYIFTLIENENKFYFGSCTMLTKLFDLWFSNYEVEEINNMLEQSPIAIAITMGETADGNDFYKVAIE